MRIALLSHEYPPETGYGGIGTYTFHQARGLAALGHDVTVFCGSAKPAPALVTREAGVRIVRLQTALPAGWERSFDRDRLGWTRGRMRNGLAMWQGLEELSRRHAFDLLEAPECGAEAWLIAAQRQWPVVIRFHSPAELIMPYYHATEQDRMLSAYFERLGVLGAASYTACSEFMSREATQKYHLAQPAMVIHNGLDLDWFDNAAPAPVRERTNIPRGNTLIFFGARLERRKGADLLAEIMLPILERYPVSFVVAGADNNEGILCELQRCLGRSRVGTFHYLGRLGLDDVRSWLHAASICLIPSRWENCPYSCLEAMAARTAIVAFRVGGLPELVSDQVTGLLAEPNDVPAFRRAVCRLVEDPRLAERFGRAGRSRIEQRFTVRQMAERSMQIYRETANAAP
ncbi:MAG TPA: glycosyltransferase family 4 protein [Pirellulales bacterium]|nr:glycosyltransferase family 4 protein [Pirellulales bacterium]